MQSYFNESSLLNTYPAFLSTAIDPMEGNAKSSEKLFLMSVSFWLIPGIPTKRKEKGILELMTSLQRCGWVGSISSANGSALVRLGDTIILCGIRAEVAEPDLLAPNSGFLGPLLLPLLFDRANE